MKKTKLIALTMVVAIMMIGAGYAAWTDFTQINGTLETGNMDVLVRWANLNKPPRTEGDVTISDDLNTITFNASNLYPTNYNGKDNTTYGRLHFSLENRGSVPVKLGDLEFTKVNENSPLWDYMKTVIHIHYGTPSATGTSLATEGSLTGTNPISGDLKDLGSLIANSKLKDFVLEPGKAIWFGAADPTDPEDGSIRYYLHKDAPNTTQNEEIGFTLKFNWEQGNL